MAAQAGEALFFHGGLGADGPGLEHQIGGSGLLLQGDGQDLRAGHVQHERGFDGDGLGIGVQQDLLPGQHLAFGKHVLAQEHVHDFRRVVAFQGIHGGGQVGAASTGHSSEYPLPLKTTA